MTRGRLGLGLAALLLAAVLGASCAGPGLRARNADVSTRIAQARSQGALTCAPVELATAEAQYAFAAQELSEGNHRAAKAAVGAAEVAVTAAIDKSPADRCAPPGDPPPPPAPGDKDGDGIKDDVDDCPDVAEDKDGYLDDDGCPEPDNNGGGLLLRSRRRREN